DPAGLLGWHTDPGSTYGLPGGTALADGMSVFAIWAPVVAPGPDLVRTFHGHGGTPTLETVVFAEGEFETYGMLFDEVGVPAREGIPGQVSFQFAGWFTASVGGDEVLADEPVDMETLSRRLYARWDVTIDTPVEPTRQIVIFDAMGGEPAVQWTTVDFGGTYADVLDDITVPEREGHNFLGWFLADGNPFDETADVTDDNVLELFARWVEIVIPLGDAHHAYLIGLPDGTIRPSQPITRAEVAMIFFRVVDDEVRSEAWATNASEMYTDIRAGAWFNNAVATMTNAGVFVGLPDGRFAPYAPITRGEAAVTIARFVSMGDDEISDVSFFSDIAGHWTEASVNMLAQLGWVKGNGSGEFRPDDPITRAEMAALINRMLGRNIRSADDLHEDMRRWPDNANPNAWYYLDIQAASNTAEYVRNADGTITWVAILEPLDFTILNRPDATPADFALARELWLQQRAAQNN
ncbi:MAG: S-layer homology domain-containing protein, partial [Oscillospiraceae bacterium]|nr:S-layer homology domain-containing protein [Oscillospiraceae bacterium]